MDITTAPGISLVNGRYLRVVRIGSENVEAYWPQIQFLLAKGYKALRPLGGAKAVHKNCYRGVWQFFMLVEKIGNIEKPIAGMITEISKRPDGMALVILWLGGEDLKTIKRFSAKFDKWAKILGCDFIELWARKGFTRTLVDVGFKTEQYIMRKRIRP